MSESSINFKRRNLLKLAVTGAVAIPVSSLILSRTAMAEALPHLSEDDPTAKALNYVQDASKSTNAKHVKGRFCHNCNLVKATEGEWRGCSIFPGKAVNQNGWCMAWVGKA